MPFLLPTVAPESEEEFDAYDALDTLLSSGAVSSAMGWAIAQGEELVNNLPLLREIKCSLRGKFKGRSIPNRSKLLFFLKQVMCLVATVMLLVHNILSVIMYM